MSFFFAFPFFMFSEIQKLSPHPTIAFIDVFYKFLGIFRRKEFFSKDW